MRILILEWLRQATLAFIKNDTVQYIAGFAFITGCLFTLIPLMNFSTGFQVGLVLGAYNWLTKSKIL